MAWTCSATKTACFVQNIFRISECTYVVNLPIFVKIHVMVQQPMFTTTFSGNISPQISP